jgi:hypothetical protein
MTGPHAEARDLLADAKPDLGRIARLVATAADPVLTAYVSEHLADDVWVWVPGSWGLNIPAAHWGVNDQNWDPGVAARWNIPPLFVKRTPVTRLEFYETQRGAEDTLFHLPNHADGDLPMVGTSHRAAMEYCRLESWRLGFFDEPESDATAQVRLPTPQVRLPSAVEWQHFSGELPRCKGCWGRGFYYEAEGYSPHHACNGTGMDLTWYETHVWTPTNSGGEVQPVGTRKAGAFGLMDLWGMGWEWGYYGGVHGGPAEVAPLDMDQVTFRTVRTAL